MSRRNLEGEVLNPNLYGRLCAIYGKDGVKVTNPGMAIDWEVVRKTKTDGTSYMSRQVNYPGEQYVVRCSKCHDHRQRLSFNHRWGVHDEATGGRNLWMAHCFNERCYSDFDDQRDLYDFVYAPILSRHALSEDIRKGRDPSEEQQKVSQWPGAVIPLAKLCKSCPDHPAVEYLRSRRNFDPLYLGERWGLTFCVDSRHRSARNRIVIPFYGSDGKMIGWQARYIGDSVNGVPFNKANVPKYYTAPTFRKSLHPYNFERAISHRMVVIVEGVTDVWRVGPMATAVLGSSSMSPQCVDRMVSQLYARYDDPVVAVVMDPKKPSEQAQLSLSQQQADRLVASMSGRVVPVELPTGCDPASLDRDVVRSLIAEAVTEAGYEPSFDRPLPAPEPAELEMSCFSAL